MIGASSGASSSRTSAWSSTGWIGALPELRRSARIRCLSTRVGPNPRSSLFVVLAIVCACCARTPEAVEKTLVTTSTPSATTGCHIYDPNACRVGCDIDEPKKVLDVAPDLSRIDVTTVRRQIEIAEILIDTEGVVKQVCVLRGVRDDIDVRVVAAIRQWRFQPARLRHSTPKAEAGTLVSPVLTVTVRIDR
jgi:hypothetical protein